MEGEEEHQLILHRAIGPSESATVGRVMTSLLNAKLKKLQDAISRLHSPPKIGPPTASLEQSLWFLYQYVGDAVAKGEHIDQVLIPIAQHSPTVRGSKQTLVLLNWLFQDEILFENVVRNLAAIISRRDDHHVALGWCILIRSLVNIEDTANSVATNAIKEKNEAILKIFCPQIIHLISLLCNGSHVREGFDLPTRLAVAAADLILSLTAALTTKDPASSNTTKKQNSFSTKAKSQPINLLPETSKHRDGNTSRKALESPSGLELKLLLWNYLSELITLVKKLTAWSRKSRSLHAKGLERVFKWLEELKQLYGCFQDETKLQVLKTGSLLLSSCWKHYGILLRLEDPRFNQKYKELLDQYLSGLQFYADNQAGEPDMGKGNSLETINFFLNCLLLILGRLDNELFRSAITEFGSQISQILLSQLQCADEEVIDGAISIFKAVIFRTNHASSMRSLDDVREMDDLLPMLLDFLDEQDAAAKAIVKLIAEYFSIRSDSKYLSKVLRHINSKNVAQRRNAVDIVAELIHLSLSSETANALSQAAWQEIANHMLQCLGDEDVTIRMQASNLIPMIEPALVLPALVGLSYSTDERAQISASNSLTALMMYHKQKPDILCLLIDCISKLPQNSDAGTIDNKKESKIDVDRLLKLLPEWAKDVEDWHVMVPPLIDKMLAEPSNPVTVRLLSYLSEYLVEAVEAIFRRLILYMRQQEEIDSQTEIIKQEHRLFSHLCPLLVIKILPLRVFDDLNSSLVYGELPKFSATHADSHCSIEDSECIASLMINRALSKSEFEDVRKLAAELCGRIHPKVLIPILSSELRAAANANDVLKIKICLFSLCTCLMVRGSEAHKHSDLSSVRESIQKIMLWTSVDRDVSKAQHGCIDCMALMLCTELQAPEPPRGTAVSRNGVLVYVLNKLTGSDISCECDGGDPSSHLPFRLCMANVLISACQKIPDKAKKPFVRSIVPPIIQSLKAIRELEIRAACIQFLFTVAYHLKPFIAPYSNDLLGLTLKSLRECPNKEEKMASVKLLASLMSSEEEVIEDMSAGLLQARQLLENLSKTDPSPDVRQICQQLLVCFSPQRAY